MKPAYLFLITLSFLASALANDPKQTASKRALTPEEYRAYRNYVVKQYEETKGPIEDGNYSYILYANKQLINDLIKKENNELKRDILETIINSDEELESLQVAEGKILALGDKLAKRIPAFSKNQIMYTMLQTEYQMCLKCSKTLPGWCDTQYLILMQALNKNAE